MPVMSPLIRFSWVVRYPAIFCHLFKVNHMRIIENKALLFTTPKAAQITSLIPKSKLLPDGQLLVNWDFEEVQLLRNLGIPEVPSPILGRYNWPGVYTPFDHQRTTAEFLTLHPRCFVFNEAGTGKTSAAAWASDYLMTQGKVHRVLIVCPVSIMETVRIRYVLPIS